MTLYVHPIPTDLLDSSPRYSHLNCGVLDIHQRPQVQYSTPSGHQRVDPATTGSNPLRRWCLCVPSFHETCEGSHGQLGCCRLVYIKLPQLGWMLSVSIHKTPTTWMLSVGIH